MKTVIIHLESSDNQPSICDKIGGIKAQRILLVWPKRSRLLENEIDLRIVKRRAQELGAQIALVCRNSRVIEAAKVLEIPVFPSVPSAEKSHWKNSFSLFDKKEDSGLITGIQNYQQSKQKKQVSRILLAFSRGIAIVLGSIAIAALVLFLVPSARIILYPVLQQKEIVISVWASPEVKEMNINGNLPAKKQTIKVSGSLTGSSSGKTGIADAFAEGDVILKNLTNNEIEIPEGTVLSTATEPIVRFSTTESETLPAGLDATIKIHLKAKQAGTIGNVESGAISVVEGSIGAQVSTSNEAAFSGGTDQNAPSPSEEDYTELKAKLIDQLKQDAAKELAAAGTVLIPGSLEPGTLVSEIRSLEPGQPGDQFSLSITEEFSGLTYSRAEMEKMARMALEASLGSGQAVYQGQISLETGEDSISKDGANWQETVTANIIPVIDETSLAQKISGQTIDEALKKIEAVLPSRQTPDIQLFFTWKHLPLASYQIQFQVK